MSKIQNLITISFLALMLLLGVAAAIASPSQPNRQNSFGVSEIYQNPNTYLLALPIAGQVLDERFTNIRFQPYAAAVLYDESILFCGDVTDKFNGMTGVLVVTYRTQASGKYQGVGCHELLSVFQVKSPEVNQ
jgi:hypothetical protein